MRFGSDISVSDISSFCKIDSSTKIMTGTSRHFNINTADISENEELEDRD